MNVDPLARVYRWIEYAAFGRTLERARFRFLDRLATARYVLMLGEGDGRTLARLLTLAPQAKINVLDLSGQMIALARRRAENSNRVHFRLENILTASLPGNLYDGVTTMFFLDCFSASETAGLMEKIAAAMAPGGLWLVSEFALPCRGWRRWHAKLWFAVMYRFFAVTTGLNVRSLPPIEKLLLRHGFERLERSEYRAGLICSEVWRKPPTPPPPIALQ